MRNGWVHRKLVFDSDHLAGGLIFIAALTIFWLSPVRQVTDSKYSMLLSECLLNYRSFALDHYAVPRLEPFAREDYVMDGDIYQLELAGGHVYYFFPPGSSILSIPYVALANALGVTASNPDGTYNQQGEIEIEAGLAAILMSLLATVFYFTSRLLLPKIWSSIIALGAAFGTEVWSTASRALWSHTWAILLLGLALYFILAHETGRRCLPPILLATLLAWMYFVRPSTSIYIIALSLYILLYYARKFFLRYAVMGLLWLISFFIYSWIHFHHLLPNYFRASRLNFESFFTALYGNLLSPARGFLIYVPVSLFIFYLLARYRHEKPLPSLVYLSLIVFAAHLIVISGFAHWWGGASYGARFMTDAVPWLVLLSILAVRAMLNRREKEAREKSSLAWPAQLIVGTLLLTLSIFVNSRGALSYDAWKWNEHPDDMQVVKHKLWDWREAQFLAGLVRPPLSHDYPLIEGETRIDFTSHDSDKFLWYGWSGPEPNLRWSESKEVAMVFALSDIKEMRLRVRLAPFLAPGALNEQRLKLRLNGQLIKALSLTEGRDYELTFELPKNHLRDKNALFFELPDATSPVSLKLSTDERPLGIAVFWIELQPVENGVTNSACEPSLPARNFSDALKRWQA